MRKACCIGREESSRSATSQSGNLQTTTRFRQAKSRVIHNGVDTNKFQPAADKRKVKAELGFNPDDPAIVSVGRLYARKGLFTLIESMPAVVKRFPKAKFIVSGKGQSDEMHKLTAYAEKIGVHSNLIFTGYYPDKKLPLLYQAADVFAFSTFYEHHPFAVLEALSTGLARGDDDGRRDS